MSINKYDIFNPQEGHFERFKLKMDAQEQPSNKSNNMRWYLLAASVALIVSLWYNFKSHDKIGYELSDVSEQMKETEDYFSSVIQSEIKKVSLQKDANNTMIINDALHQVEVLESEYVNLSKELKVNGFEKRIIHAMIFNYQQRIEILQDLLSQINQIKSSKNENNIQV